jgi:hypothetical protein
LDRSFALPVVSTLALTVTGCTSAGDFEGLWSVTSLELDGTVYAYPQSDTYVDGRVTYTYTYGFDLEVKEDGRGTFTQYYHYTDSRGSDERDEYGYAIAWVPGKGRAFDVEVDEFGLSMACTPDGDDMLCEGELEDTSVDFTGSTSYDYGYETTTEIVPVVLELVRKPTAKE